ncbi:MAG TPA: hypothetical protein VIX84_18810 [Acidimicrobiales bacterium]
MTSLDGGAGGGAVLLVVVGRCVCAPERAGAAALAADVAAAPAGVAADPVTDISTTKPAANAHPAGATRWTVVVAGRMDLVTLLRPKWFGGDGEGPHDR